MEGIGDAFLEKVTKKAHVSAGSFRYRTNNTSPSAPV
jgi:hypothetical protein